MQIHDFVTAALDGNIDPEGLQNDITSNIENLRGEILYGMIHGLDTLKKYFELDSDGASYLISALANPVASVLIEKAATTDEMVTTGVSNLEALSLGLQYKQFITYLVVSGIVFGVHFAETEMRGE